MVSSDGAVFLSGTQFSPNYLQNAPRAFVDKVNIKTAQDSAFPGRGGCRRNGCRGTGRRFLEGDRPS